MATFAVNGIYRLVSRFKYSSLSDIQNAWHFICTTGGTVAEAAIKTAVQNWLDTVFDSLLTHINNAIDPFDLKMDLVQFNPSTERFDIQENVLFTPWVMAAVPGAANDALPLQDSAVVNLRTPRPQTVGRRFLPPFVESDSDSGGVLTSSALADSTLAAADMLLSLTAGTASLVPGVPSKYSGTDTHFFRYTSAGASPRYCTQRRRRIGIGG